MFDGETILTQVRQGVPAPDWQIYYGRSRYFLARGLLFAGIGLICISTTVISVTISLSSLSLIQTNEAQYVYFYMVIALVTLCAGIVVFDTSISWFKKAMTARQQMLILLPTGVVVCENTGPQPTFVIHYADTLLVEIHIWHTRHRKGIYLMHTAVMIHDKNGGSTQWEIDERFGAPAVFAQAIIAAQSRYAALHESASA